jgi:hypothetical protein
MKKFAALMLGLSLALGSVAFAQEAPKKEEPAKEAKKEKKAAKKAPKKEEKKEEKK